MGLTPLTQQPSRFSLLNAEISSLKFIIGLTGLVFPNNTRKAAVIHVTWTKLAFSFLRILEPPKLPLVEKNKHHSWNTFKQILKENITTLLHCQRIRSLQQEKTPVKSGNQNNSKNVCYNCSSVGQISSNEHLSELMKMQHLMDLSIITDNLNPQNNQECIFQSTLRAGCVKWFLWNRKFCSSQLGFLGSNLEKFLNFGHQRWSEHYTIATKPMLHLNVIWWHIQWWNGQENIRSNSHIEWLNM